KDDALRSDALYDAAMMEAKSSNNANAMDRAQEYLKTFPQGKYYEPCLLLLADFYGKNKQSGEAVSLLQEYLTHPAQIQRADAVNFLLGYNFQLQGHSPEALEAYAKVTLNK